MPSGEMETQNLYAIKTKNKFDIISDDVSDDVSDPYELIRAAQEQPRKEKDPKAAKGKKDIKPLKTNEKKFVKMETTADNESSENKRNDRQRGERGRGRGRGRGGDRRGRGGNDRGGDRRGRGGFRNNNFSPNNNNQEGFGFDNNNQGGFGSYQTQVADSNEGGITFGFDGEDRRGGRSGYRGRGGRGGRGRGRGGNREFDRRSGSDKSSVKPHDKKDGSGSYNWGTPQDDINAASDEHSGGFGTPKETEETPAENVEQTTENDDVPEPEPVDEGPQEMTFEEYKKQLAESRTKPEFNLRKVDSDKKGLTQLKKPTEEDNAQKSSFFFPRKNVAETYKTSGRVKENLPVPIRYGSGENRHMDGNRRGQRTPRDGKKGGRRGDDSAKGGRELALGNDDEFPSL